MNCTKLIFRQIIQHNRNFRQKALNISQQATAVATKLPEKEVLQTPTADNEEKPVSPKLENIVASIAQLNLIEVAELSQLLKKRLNIPDAPIMPMGGFVAAGGSLKADEEDEAPQAVQTSFTIKLLQFDEKQKIPLIKEIKNLLEGMNLVQAKKFVESAPIVVKSDIGKSEAEKLKEALEKVGASCEIV